MSQSQTKSQSQLDDYPFLQQIQQEEELKVEYFQNPFLEDQSLFESSQEISTEFLLQPGQRKQRAVASKKKQDSLSGISYHKQDISNHKTENTYEQRENCQKRNSNSRNSTVWQQKQIDDMKKQQKRERVIFDGIMRGFSEKENLRALKSNDASCVSENINSLQQIGDSYSYQPHDYTLHQTPSAKQLDEQDKAQNIIFEPVEDVSQYKIEEVDIPTTKKCLTQKKNTSSILSQFLETSISADQKQQKFPHKVNTKLSIDLKKDRNHSTQLKMNVPSPSPYTQPPSTITQVKIKKPTTNNNVVLPKKQENSNHGNISNRQTKLSSKTSIKAVPANQRPINNSLLNLANSKSSKSDLNSNHQENNNKNNKQQNSEIIENSIKKNILSDGVIKFSSEPNFFEQVEDLDIFKQIGQEEKISEDDNSFQFDSYAMRRCTAEEIERGRQFFGTIREEENEDFDQTPLCSENIFKQLGKSKRDELDRQLIEEEIQSYKNTTTIKDDVTKECDLSDIQQDSLFNLQKRGRFFDYQKYANQKVGVSSCSHSKRNKKRGKSEQQFDNLSENSFSAQGGVFEESIASQDSSSASSECYQISTPNLKFNEQETENTQEGEGRGNSLPKENQNLIRGDGTLTRGNLDMLIEQDKVMRNSQIIIQDKTAEEVVIDNLLTQAQKIQEIERLQSELKKEKERVEEEKKQIQKQQEEIANQKLKIEQQKKLWQEQNNKISQERQELNRMKQALSKMQEAIKHSKSYIPQDRDEEESYSQYCISLQQRSERLLIDIQDKETQLAVLEETNLNLSLSQSFKKQSSAVVEEILSPFLPKNRNKLSTPPNGEINNQESSGVCVLLQNLEKEEQKYQMQQNQILKEGWLKKKSPSLFKPWKPKYFVLTATKIQYYKEESKRKLRGCINFKIASCRVGEINGEKFSLIIDGQKKKFELKSNAKFTSQEWINLIQISISQNEKIIKPFLKTLKAGQYFKRDQITEEEFFNTAQTGDVVLFETNNIGAKFQRKITGSKYDHVGLCLRMEKGDLRIFDSQVGEGVSLSEWQEFIKKNDLYDMVCLRRLQNVNREEIQDKLLNFLLANFGKKYSITLKKIVFQSCGRNEMGREIDPSVYFCSELVAQFFKNIDLLPQSKPACSYWPISFSQEKDLKLLQGAKLSDEVLVVLNRHRNKQKEQQLTDKEIRSRSLFRF